MKDEWISYTAGVTQFLFSVYYFFTAFRISAIYQNLNVPQPNPVFQNLPAILFLFFAIANLYYGYARKTVTKKGKQILYSSIISIILMILPFAVMYFFAYFSSMNVLKSIQEMGVY